MSYYIHYLDPFRPTPATELACNSAHVSSRPTPQPLPSPTFAAPSVASNDNPILLLGGYSYGAMVTTNLPALDALIAPFHSPMCGSSAAEIRLRAQHLAEMQNTILASARTAAIDQQRGRSHRKSLGLRIGGDEENRKSHDSKRSFSIDLEDMMRKGVMELMAKARKGQKRRSVMSGDMAEGGLSLESAPESLLPVANHVSHRPAYLLISPLQGMITNLATMSFPSPFTTLYRGIPPRSFSWWGKSGSLPSGCEGGARKEPSLIDAELKLILNPTLAIYGDQDSFVAVRKLRAWASRLEAVPDSRFRAHEVSGAGHFWMQGNAAVIMGDAVRTFAQAILVNQDATY